MKILLVECSDFDTFPTGGQLSFFKSLIPALKLDPIVVGVSLSEGESIGVWRKKNIAGRDVPFFSVGMVNPQKSFLDKFFPYRIRFLLWLYRYRKKILESEAQAIYVQTQETALPFVHKGIPLVLRFAGAANPMKCSRFFWARAECLQRFYEIAISRYVLPRVSNIIAIDQKCADLGNKFGNHNHTFIPLGVDRGVFNKKDKKKCRQDVGITSVGPVLVFVGRLSKIKGLDLLIDSFELFHAKHSEAQLIVIGDGEERDSLQKYVVAKGLSSVRLTGNLAHDDVSKFLNAADVFLITSIIEGVPNAMLEAMSCGLPVVATDVGGISEVLEHEVNGCLVNSKDPHVMVENIEKALANADKFGDNALSLIEEKYSIDKVAQQTGVFFEGLICQKK